VAPKGVPRAAEELEFEKSEKGLGEANLKLFSVVALPVHVFTLHPRRSLRQRLRQSCAWRHGGEGGRRHQEGATAAVGRPFATFGCSEQLPLHPQAHCQGVNTSRFVPVVAVRLRCDCLVWLMHKQDAAVVANTAAISLEEVTPVGVSSSATFAPEQLQGKKKREDDLMGDGDVNRDERKRRRAKHKRIVSAVPFAFLVLSARSDSLRCRSSACAKRKTPSAWPSACRSAPSVSAAPRRAR
jgi:hypothetical protein